MRLDHAATARPDETLGRARGRTLLVLWATYGSFYFCRANIGPAVPAIRRHLGFGALEIGLVLGAVKLGYALGQLVNGQLTERLGPRRVLAAGMIGSAAATLLLGLAPELGAMPVLGVVAAALASRVASVAHAFGADASVSPTLGVMLLLAFANGWFQAGGWPPLVKIAARWFEVGRRGRTMGVLGTSYTVGSAVAIFAVGGLLDATGGNWRVAFVAPALVLAASFVHTALRLREHPPDDSGDPAPAAARGPDRLPVAEALHATLGNPRVWILAFGLLGVDAVRYGFLDWAPGHLAEVQRSGAWSSAGKTAVFALAGALGTLSSGWISDRFFQARRAPVCAVLLAAVAALTWAYRAVVGVGWAPTVVCLALTGFCLYGAQILLVGTAAQDFARRGATAAAAGFIDFMGHVGAFGGDVVTGWMLKRHGWAGAIAWWAAAAMMSAALVATLWRARPDAAARPS